VYFLTKTIIRPEETKEVSQKQSDINMRNQCNIGCKYYFKCPLMKLAIERKPPECLMKTWDRKQVIRFLRLDGGEKGVSSEIEHVLWEMGEQLDLEPENLKLRTSYMDLMLRYYKLKFIDQKAESTDKDITVQVTTVAERKSKMVPVGDRVFEVPVELISTEDDPESLFNSPLVENIIRREDGGKASESKRVDD